jgi:hypothetical protein
MLRTPFVYAFGLIVLLAGASGCKQRANTSAVRDTGDPITAEGPAINGEAFGVVDIKPLLAEPCAGTNNAAVVDLGIALPSDAAPVKEGVALALDVGGVPAQVIVCRGQNNVFFVKLAGPNAAAIKQLQTQLAPKLDQIYTDDVTAGMQPLTVDIVTNAGAAKAPFSLPLLSRIVFLGADAAKAMQEAGAGSVNDEEKLKLGFVVLSLDYNQQTRSLQINRAPIRLLAAKDERITDPSRPEQPAEAGFGLQGYGTSGGYYYAPVYTVPAVTYSYSQTYSYTRPNSHPERYENADFICSGTGGRPQSSRIYRSQPSCGSGQCNYPGHITGRDAWACCREDGC